MGLMDRCEPSPRKNRAPTGVVELMNPAFMAELKQEPLARQFKGLPPLVFGSSSRRFVITFGISGVGAMSFSTVARPNLGQHPTFDPGSSLLWESSTLKVAQGGRRPTAVLNAIGPSGVLAFADPGRGSHEHSCDPGHRSLLLLDAFPRHRERGPRWESRIRHRISVCRP